MTIHFDYIINAESADIVLNHPNGNQILIERYDEISIIVLKTDAKTTVYSSGTNGVIKTVKESVLNSYVVDKNISGLRL